MTKINKNKMTKTTNEKFLVGEVAYIVHGVGEINIQAVKINKINRKTKTAIVETCAGGREFEVDLSALDRDSEAISLAYVYIRNNQPNSVSQIVSTYISKNFTK
jgi:hypothetical protein